MQTWKGYSQTLNSILLLNSTLFSNLGFWKRMFAAAPLCCLIPNICSCLVARWRHVERENLQAVYKDTARGRETKDSSGQRTQVHVHFPPSAHLLFPLQGVHLVRESNENNFCLHISMCSRCNRDSVSVIGVFLESRVTSVKVRKPHNFFGPFITVS